MKKRILALLAAGTMLLTGCGAQNAAQSDAAKSGSDDVYMVGKLAAFQIQNLLVAYKERFDKDNFIKNLLLDNLLLVDIYNRAKKLHIETNVKRVVFLIETKNEKDTNALETMRSLFSTKTKDFITAVDEKNIILVREVKPGETYEDLEKTANTILDMLNTEAMSKVRIAFGTIVGEIKDVSRSYKEAKMALDVGKIFIPGCIPVFMLVPGCIPASFCVKAAMI